MSAQVDEKGHALQVLDSEQQRLRLLCEDPMDDDLVGKVFSETVGLSLRVVFKRVPSNVLQNSCR